MWKLKQQKNSKLKQAIKPTKQTIPLPPTPKAQTKTPKLNQIKTNKKSGAKLAS